MSAFKTAEIAKCIFWVGGDEQNGGLHCNPYLIVEEDEAILIDPGSVLDFEYVFENVCNIVPLEKVCNWRLSYQQREICKRYCRGRYGTRGSHQ